MSTIARHDQRPRSATSRGLRDALALAPAIVPMGFALGVALAELTPPPMVSWLTAPLMVAGSAQLVLIGQLDGGAGIAGAVIAAILVNLRFSIYGAALASRFASQPPWFRWIAPHNVVEQTYGLVVGRISADDPDDGFRRYFMASGTLLWAVWSCSVGAGLLGGSALPEALPLEFILSAMFVALVVPGIANRADVWAGAAGVAVALAGLPATVTVAGATVAGAVIAAVTRGGRS